MNQNQAVHAVSASWPLRALIAAIAGAAFVAIGAQIAVPLPGTPVPVTFQVPAVLIVGGLLGLRLGAASMATYLLAGVAGLPVFAPVGAFGIARLIGPTGGYLLAFGDPDGLFGGGHFAFADLKANCPAPFRPGQPGIRHQDQSGATDAKGGHGPKTAASANGVWGLVAGHADIPSCEPDVPISQKV